MYEVTVTMVGNVAGELTQKSTAGGQVVSFRMIASRRLRDQTTGEWRDGDRFSVKVNCWRRLGENVIRSIGKGDPVIVQGRLHESEWQVEGVRRRSNEITAGSVGPDLGRCRAFVTRSGGASTVPGPTDDEVPVDVSHLREVPPDADDLSDEVFPLRPVAGDEQAAFDPERDDESEPLPGRDAMAG